MTFVSCEQLAKWQQCLIELNCKTVVDEEKSRLAKAKA